jgi:lactoylglutathione lyase
MNAQEVPISMVKPTLDVGVIVSNMEKSRAFYGGILGLKETAALAMPDGTTMVRYQAGSAVLKLRAFPNAAKFPGGIRAGVGVRLLTIYFSDLTSIIKRWVDSGGAEPKLTNGITKGAKVAFLSDPDENQVEIVGLPPEMDAAKLDKIAVGLTVANTEKSREFYGKLLGLPEDEAVQLPSGGKEYRFMAGTSQIKFWAGDGNVPVHTGNITDAIGFRYFTFIVNDVDAVAILLKGRGAKIAVPPTDFGTIARIMMVSDPDGNWIEFAARKAQR